MELLFQDKKIQFDQNPGVEYIVEKINEWLGHSYYFSHLIVNGISVYEELEQYLTENIFNIQQIEVIAKTQWEFMNVILLTTENYLIRAVGELTTLIDGFYNAPTAEHWAIFSDMLEGMEWINQVILSIDHMKERPANWEEYIKQAAMLQVELENMEEAMKNSDHVLIADIIQYELVPIYEALQQEIKTTTDTEETQHDVN